MTPEIRDEFFKRLAKRGVTPERKDYDAAQSYINRMLDLRISILAFGDSTAKRRLYVKDDNQLKKALELLRHGSTTKELFAIAATTPSPSAKPER